MTTWRVRLDRTANWSIILTAALLTWSFSARDHPHYLLLVALFAVVLFLLIEARRYRHYDVFRWRVRLLETSFFAPSVTGNEPDDPDWRQELARDLRQPALRVPWREAIQRRLRRRYFALIAILATAWLLRVTALPREAETLAEAARIAAVPGLLVLSSVSLALLVLIVLTLWPLKRHAEEELRREDDD